VSSPFLGIEIGGSKLQIVSSDDPCRIQHRWRLSVERDQGATGICRQLDVTLTECLGTVGQPRSVGVGFGGPVDWRSGTVSCSHQIEGWAGFELREWLQDLLKVPVCVDNDANVAALGEAVGGAGRSFDLIFYVTLGSGVGGGLVVDGQIYHGANPGEAEIGHVRLDRRGRTVESRCSGWAADRKLREYRSVEPTSRLSQLMGSYPGMESKCLGMALAENEPAARRILAETAEDLAFGLSHVVHLIHPEAIILGGGLSQVGEPLRQAVQEALSRYVMKAFATGPAISLAELGEDAVPVGGMILARNAWAPESARH
jgi:glucokinase